MLSDRTTSIRHSCGSLIAVTLSLDADVRLHCGKCKEHFLSERTDLPRLVCPICSRWLASGIVRSGILQLACRRCKMLARFPDSLIPLEHEPKPVIAKPSVHRGRPKAQRRAITKAVREYEDAAILTAIEGRWQTTLRLHTQNRAEVAVGIRFDVFTRDGFRCVYCGRAAADGAMLEADHLMPRSKGGPDTLANLVTSCWECNRGKRDKLLPDGLDIRLVRNNLASS